MNSELEILESVVKPVQLVWALGLPLEVANGHHLCGLDAPGQFRVTDQGFLSTGDDIFQGGTCLDFAAYRAMRQQGLRGRQAFVAGARDIITALKHQLDGLRPEHAETIGHAAFLRRRIFDFVRERTVETHIQPSARNIQALTTIRGLGIDRNLLPGTLALFENDDWAEFRQRCDAAEVSIPALHFHNSRLVVPFYSAPGVLAYLEIYEQRKEKLLAPFVARILPIFPSRLAFSGLHAHVPGEPVLLHQSSLQAAAMTSFIRAERGRGSCMSVQTDMSVGAVGWRPDEVVFLEDESEPLLNEPAVLDLEGIRVWTSAAQDMQMACTYRTAWRDQLIERILHELRTEGFSAEVRTLLIPCKNSLPLRHKLLQSMDGLPSDVRTKVEDMLQDGLVLSNKSIKIFDTLGGYRFCVPGRGEDGPLHELSNFTMKLGKSIVFPDEANFFHEVSVRMRTGEFTAILQSDDLESARKLDKAIKQGCMLAGFDEDNDTPVITDLLTARHLIPYWRAATAKLPKEQGIAFLGWDSLKRQYHAPDFIAGTSLTLGARNMHPGIEVLKFFNNNDLPIPVMHDTLPADLADIVSQAVAMCARAHAGHPVRPVAVLNTGDAPRVLRSIFQVIGQASPIELNMNQRVRELPGLRGWPAWGTGYTPQQVSSSTMSLFMLGDRGFRLESGHTDAELRMAGEALAWLLRQTAMHMVKSGQYFRRQHGVLYETELAREGAHLICRLANLTEWPISQTQYELLEKVLRDIPPAEVKQWFEHDLRNQTVMFNCRKLPRKIDRRDLLLQFSSLVRTIEERDGQFVMDAVSAVALLDNFYQGDGVPAPVNLPVLQVVEN